MGEPVSYQLMDFPQLVRQTKTVVLKAIGENLFDRFDAYTEDVLQETYFRAFKALRKQQFKGESQITTWIFTIAKNESHRMNEKLTREEERAKKFAREVLLNNPNPPSSDSMEFWESLVEKIPEPFQASFKLYLKGRKMEEIASELLLQKNTVKTRIFRAKAFLKKLGKEPNQKGATL